MQDTHKSPPEDIREKNARVLHFSIQGEYITNKAREMFYHNNDFCTAIELLMGSLSTDEISEGERLGLAMAVLDGRAEIKGVYPGPEYRLERLLQKDARWDVKTHMTGMKAELERLKEHNQNLEDKIACIDVNLSDEDKARINEEWSELDDGVIFGCAAMTRRPVDFDAIYDAPGRMTVPPDKSAIAGIAQILANPEQALNSVLDRMRSERDDDYGWLAPDGTFYPVEFGEHTGWAIDYVKAHTKKHEIIPSEAADYLHGLGWILMHNPSMGLAFPTIPDTVRVTGKQKNFLYGYYMDRGHPELAQKYFEAE